MTVYISTYSGTKRKYHTEKSCSHLSDNYREWTLEDAQKLDYSECAYCADEVEHPQTEKRSLRNYLFASGDKPEFLD